MLDIINYYTYHKIKRSSLKKFDVTINCIDLIENVNSQEIYSQGMLGSCVINSFCFMLKYKLKIMNILLNFKPSRYYLYHYSCIESYIESYDLFKIYDFILKKDSLITGGYGGGSCPFF